jgi:uncharacterized phage protein gp47/JayE
MNMGITIKEQDDIINDILIDLVENVTRINDLNPGSVIRTLAEALAQETYLQYEQLKSIYDGTRILTATDDDLDNIGAIIGVKRIDGGYASGLVTFIRNSVATSNFTIPSDTVVSTQPGLTNVYQYTTTENATFNATIPSEVHSFYSGVRRYKLSQRLIGAITSLTGTKSSAFKSFVKDTDYAIKSLFEGYIVTDNSSIVVLDACSSTAGWTGSTDAIAVGLEGTDKIEGTNALKLGKSGTTQEFLYYTKELSSTTDIESKKVFVNLKILDQTALDKIEKVNIYLSSDTTPTNNYYKKVIDVDDLSIGWDEYVIDYLTDSNITRLGSPNPTQIKSIKIEFELPATTTVFTSGDILLDFIYASTADYYTGDIIEFISYSRYPDDSTNMTFNWKPLSLDINCIAEEIGADYNVSKDSVIYKVSSVPYINSVNNYVSLTNGTDIETDDNYRQRIQNAASSPGKASINALENALLSIPGVVSVIVDDLPERTIEDEAQIFNDNTLKNKLLNEVAFVDDNVTPTNILVTDTFGGTADYTYVTDYELDDNNYIVWNSGGTNPTHEDIFYVDYQCNWLGHVEILVAAQTFPITQTLSDLIDEVILETKAAGVSVTWKEPDVVQVNIECDVTVNTDAGYNSDTVKEEVQSALINWLNNMQINENVLLSEFYKIVMNVSGVSNVEIVDWNGDTVAPFSDITIASTEIARPKDSEILVN